MIAMSLSRDLLFLIRQFCDEKKLPKTAYISLVRLEQEAALYFDMSYFEDLVLKDHWKEADDYLSGLLRKQKYLEATTNHCPHLLRPRTGCVMIKGVTDDAFKVVSPYLVLCKTDSYVVSSSGRAVSLYNAVTFKNMRSLILPPPTATSLGFYPPDYNIIVIGLDDSTIMIYNIGIDEVTTCLGDMLKGLGDIVNGESMSLHQLQISPQDLRSIPLFIFHVASVLMCKH